MLPLLAFPFSSASFPFLLCWHSSLSCQVENLLTGPTLQEGTKTPTSFALPHPSPQFPFSVPTWLFFIHTWHAELEWAHMCRSRSSSFVSSEKPKCQCSSAWVHWTTCDLLSPCREPDGHLEHAFLFYSYCITLKASQIFQAVLALTFHINNCCS